jgi:CheY-like chemotaxis protein
MNPPAPLPPSLAATDETIFVLDDDENDRLLLARRLQAAGVSCRCRLFRSGGELLDALIDVLRGARAPMACFVDVKMAGMTGLDVLRWIRAQHGLDEIPVIMLSSSDSPEYLSEAHQFGAQCYATKFPDPATLAHIVAAARNYCAAARCHSAFALPCNLLATAQAVTLDDSR